MGNRTKVPPDYNPIWRHLSLVAGQNDRRGVFLSAFLVSFAPVDLRRYCSRLMAALPGCWRSRGSSFKSRGSSSCPGGEKRSSVSTPTLLCSSAKFPSVLFVFSFRQDGFILLVFPLSSLTVCFLTSSSCYKQAATVFSLSALVSLLLSVLQLFVLFHLLFPLKSLLENKQSQTSRQIAK